MIDPDSVNNYCDDVLHLLSTQQDDDEEDIGITEIALDDPLFYLTPERSCRGRFEDCVSWELDDLTVKSIFAGSATVRPSCKQKMELNREPVTDPPKAEPSIDKTTNPPGISRIGSMPLEEISRRVFAQPSRGFTPKVSTTSKSNNGTVGVTEISTKCDDSIVGGNKTEGSNFRTAKDELQIQNIKVTCVDSVF